MSNPRERILAALGIARDEELVVPKVQAWNEAIAMVERELPAESMVPEQVPTEAVVAGMQRWDEVMRRTEMTADSTTWFDLLPEVYVAMAKAIEHNQ